MIHWTWLLLAFFGGWAILSLLVAGRLADSEASAARERERADKAEKLMQGDPPRPKESWAHIRQIDLAALLAELNKLRAERSAFQPPAPQKDPAPHGCGHW